VNNQSNKIFSLPLKCKQDEKQNGKEVNLWRLRGVCLLMDVN